jgi:hypothetical protein
MTGSCWVLRDAQDRPWNDEHDAHYTAEDAVKRIKEIAEEQAGDEIPEAERANLHAVELPAPCLTLACPSCGMDAEDDEFYLHFPTSADLDQWAEASGWRWVDGEWVCFDCPTHDDEDEEDAPARPGPDDVPLPLEVLS